MTRVILTNKQTGQELPEANLVSKTSDSIVIRFDGSGSHNSFFLIEWDYREVRTFRNGDVLRRKDRSDEYSFFVHTGEGWSRIAWDSGDVYAGKVADVPIPLDDPGWELV